MGIDVGEFCRRVFVPLSLLLQASLHLSHPFLTHPTVSSTHSLSLLLHMLLSLPFFGPHSSPSRSVLLVVLTSFIRQGGKAPLTAQHLVCFISHITPLIIFCTPPSLSLSPAVVLNISQLSSSLFFTLHLLPYLHHRYHILLIFLSPPSSLLFIEGCL